MARRPSITSTTSTCGGTYLRLLDYPAASTVLVVLIAMVRLVDFTSFGLRARLI